MNRAAAVLCIFLVCRSSAAQGGALQASGQPAVLTLQEVLRRILERAPEVALARAQADRALEAVRETKSTNLPQVVTGTGLAYNNGFPLSIEGSAPSIVQVGVSQSIFSKRNRNLILEAEQNSKANGLAPEAAQNDVAARWALVYYELHHGRRAEHVWSALGDVALAQQRIMEALIEAGKARPVDLSMAQAAVFYAGQQALVAREQARVAEVELRAAAGIAGGTRIETVEPDIAAAMPAAPVEELYQRALETNPEIRQAEARVAARDFHVEAARGEAYPSLELVGQYAVFSRANNYQDFFNRFTRNNFLLGLSVQVPVFTGFRTGARVAQSRQEAAESRLELSRLKNELRRGIERAMSGLAVARGARELAQRQLQAARELLAVSESLFESGRLAPKDFDESRNKVHERQVSELEAERVLFEREMELLRLAGTASSLAR